MLCSRDNLIQFGIIKFVWKEYLFFVFHSIVYLKLLLIHFDYDT